jgi:hypothetical protein
MVESRRGIAAFGARAPSAEDKKLCGECHDVPPTLESSVINAIQDCMKGAERTANQVHKTNVSSSSFSAELVLSFKGRSSIKLLELYTSSSAVPMVSQPARKRKKKKRKRKVE